MKTLKAMPGDYVGNACRRAANWAAAFGQCCLLIFNGTEVVVHPGDTAEQVYGQWYRNGRDRALNSERECKGK